MNRNPLGTWSRVPPADGPGIHSDEASSAWPVIRKLVSPSTARAIASIDGFSVRRNPSGPFGEVGEDEEGDGAIGFEELIPVARLVTGQWGTPTMPNKQLGSRLATDIGPQLGSQLGLRPGQERRRLAVLRSNPAEEVLQGSWLDESFWPRMEALRLQLARLERGANRRYDAADKKSGLRGKRGWVIALRQMRGDVEWVIEQRAKALSGRARVVQREGSSESSPIVSVMGINPTNRFALRAPRRNPSGDLEKVPDAERKPWGAISAKGNQKLPFASYSTLPMASCPGAGGCKVELVKTGSGLTKTGYCYSFTAWRYPDSFARQFRNCLAEFTDREFAICAGGAADTLPIDISTRVDAAYRGRGVRTWHSFCRQMVERDLAGALKPAAEGGKPAFVRIYVDGDINSEDNVFEWMVFCAKLQGTRIVKDGRVLHPGIQAYGYSKNWDQFLLLDRRRVEDLLGGDWPQYVRWERGSGIVTHTPAEHPIGPVRVVPLSQFRWPDNYTLNLSADSIWNNEAAGKDSTQRRVTVAMADLPISRGYFASVNLQQSIAGLNAQFANGKYAEFPPPPAEKIPFPFNENRMRAILHMNARMNVEQVKDLPDRASKEQALKLAYIELVQEYQLESFVKRTISRAKRTLGQVKITINRVSPVFTTGSRKGQRKTDDTMVLELSESLLHNLYQAWFSFLYAHGADPSVQSLYASSFTGGQPQSFSDIVFLELARDAVDLGKKPLSRGDYLEEKRQKKMLASVDTMLNRIKKGLGGSLKDAIIYADKDAKKASRARPMADIVRELSKRLTPKQVADFQKNYDPAAFVASYATKVDEYQKKALAVALHEVLWTFNVGGSCPLVCGNCFDTPTPPLPNTDEYLQTRHRCASREGFRARTIHIGRH